MKKIVLLFLMLCLIAYGIFAQSTPHSAGVIMEITGNVELKYAGSSVFVAAQAGDEIALSTIVSTGFKSFALIAVGNSLITVRPLTRLSLAENFNVNIQTGRIKVEVNPDEGTAANCTVQSPGATALMRGTSFEFDTLYIKVNEGTASFCGVSGLPVMLKDGENSAIGPDGKPPVPAVGSLLPSAPGGNRGGGGGGSGGGGSGGGGSCCN